MHLRRSANSLGTAALLLGTAIGFGSRPAVMPAAAQTAQVWDVSAPPDIAEEQIAPNAFAPNTLTIQRGDSVRWTVEGAHTVTFLGVQGRVTDLPGFVAGGPFPGGKIAAAGFFPFGPEGNYDGSEMRSSGRPAARDDDTYTLTFTSAGVFGYLCLVHPGMNGTVTVEPTGTALAESPAQAKARGQAAQNALLDNLRAGLKGVRLANATTTAGTSTYSVAAGLSNGSGGTALQFLPADLNVHRGDSVAWVLTDPLEAHTITFTSGVPAPDFVEVVPQSNGTVVFAQKPETYGPVGGTTYTGQGYFNSGQLFGGARGPLSFVALLDAPAGTYAYLCLIHPDMKGTITVTE